MTDEQITEKLAAVLGATKKDHCVLPGHKELRWQRGGKVWFLWQDSEGEEYYPLHSFSPLHSHDDVALVRNEMRARGWLMSYKYGYGTMLEKKRHLWTYYKDDKEHRGLIDAHGSHPLDELMAEALAIIDATK